MLDKSVPFYPLIFVRFPDSPPTDAPLPPGYSVQAWQPGAEVDWCTIETAVDEFPAVDEAMQRFIEDFASEPEELSKRLFFVVTPDGKRVGNCAAWWQKRGDDRRCLLHYLAVLPEYKGLGLGRALVVQVIKAFQTLEPNEPVFLGTQTWSWRAVCLYLRCGFQLTREKDPEKALPYLEQKMPAPYYNLLIDTMLDRQWEGINQP